MKQNKQFKPGSWFLGKGFVMMTLLVFMLLFSFKANASHYRYGNISWSRVNSSTRTITVTVTQAWRRSFFGTINVGSTATGTALDFGDGTSTNAVITATSVNVTDDWFYGSFTVTHTYAGAATSFTLSYSNCCRISTLQNNADGNFSSVSVVNLVAGNTGSPVSSTPPIINLPIGQAAAAFNIPATDPDGGPLTFGLATLAQTGATNPAGLAISAAGNATFDTQGKVAGQLWQGAFVITDASGSNTIVDFMMLMVAANTPPIFDYSITPANNSVFNINPGQNINFGIKALDVDVGSTVTLSAVGLPTTNYTFTPSLPTTANPVSTLFSFTPSAAQLGIYIITFTATRNGGVQTSTNLTINVNTNPQFVAPTKLEATNYVILSGVLNVDTIKAANPDPAVNTSITSGTIPSGATMAPSLPTVFSLTPTTQMSWIPTPANFGANPVSFLATDANGRTATRNYVLEVNTVPVFSAKSDETIEPCAAYSYDIAIIDPDMAYGDDVEIIAHNVFPSWLTLTQTGNGMATISGTPSSADAGTYVISLAAEDLYHHVTGIPTQTFNLTVNSDTTPPTVTDAVGALNVNLECSDALGLANALTLEPNATDNCTAPTRHLVSDNTYHTITVAGFTSSYAPANWSLIKPSGGSGTVDTTSAPNSIQLLGSDSGSNGVRDTRYQITVPTAGVISFNWAYNTTDRDGPAFDTFGYYLNGIFHQLTNDFGDRNQSGTNSVAVAANDSFAFMIRSTDDVLGASTTVASNFTAVTQLCANEYIRVRTWNFTDDANNPSAYYEQTIHVKDTTSPTMHVKNATIYLDASGNASVVASDLNDGTTDNCGTMTYQVIPSNLNCSNLGSNTVTLRATDACGNSSQANATVTVIDALPPVTPFLSDVLLGECSGIPTPPTTTDNCAGTVTGVSSITGSIKTQGTTVVTWRFDDGNGNVTTADQNIIIQDVTPPVLTPAANQNVSMSSLCTITVPDVRGTATDNCSGLTITQDPDVGTVVASSHNGTVNVTVTATDGVGLTDVKTVVLTAKDITPPVLTAGANQNVNLNSSCAITVPDVRGTAVDSCSSTSITQSPAVGALASSAHNGVVNVTVTATDIAGNTDVKTVALTAKDVTPPTLNCPSNIMLNACQATATWATPSANDNCSGATVTQTGGSASGSTFANGTTTTITYKATDLGGNEKSCSFTVTRANPLNLTVDNSNPQLYYGYTLDQTTVIKATPSSGVAPYTVKITMNRILACNVLTSTGDEKWTTTTGTSTGNTCPASGPGLIPVSTATVAAGGSYSVSASLLSDATITVTVTDANGCVTTKTTDVYSEDARCLAGNSGNTKVKLCHRTGNASDPCHELCVSEDAVAAHLAHGDYIGACLPNCATPIIRRVVESDFNAIAYPNPSKHNFAIEILGGSKEKVDIEVYDMLSRLVRHIESNDGEVILFGDNLPSGTYFTKITQGTNQKTVKLIKE
jgi:hypothetical protein